jgi:hypothetical protein
MQLPHFPFQIIDWETIPKERHEGETGHALWQILHVGEARVRQVEYSPDYKADHWCKKGHIIFCYEGQMLTELEDGRIMNLNKGMSYIVGDNGEAHRSTSQNGCILFIVD